MHESELILTLTGGLAAALTLGFVTHRLGLSPIAGYLLAGLIVGPYTPGFVANSSLANELAEIGIILLMFGVGLHFHLKDLIAVRRVALTGALCQSAVATLLGALVGRGLGWTWSGGVVFGLALSVASTVVLTRVLVDNQDLHTPAGRISIGWLVVEDIFTVLVLVMLPAVFPGSAGEAGNVVSGLVLAIVKIAVLVAFAFVVGDRVIPKVLNAVEKTHSRELFTLAVLVLALGIAVGSALMFGASMALGAFLAGMIVGQSEFSSRAASDALPMRDAFAVLFFVSVGMLFDPRQLMQSPVLLISTLGIVLLGKPLAAFAIVTLLGHGTKIGLTVAVALAQIGEFSLILATVGDQLSILPTGATNVLVAASLVSIMLNPLLYRLIAPMEAALAGRALLWKFLNPTRQSAEFSTAPDPSAAIRYRAVVVGYGPIGQTVARLLDNGGIEPVIVDTNIESVRRAREMGRRVVYGDASNQEILDAAGIRDAVALVISGPTSEQGADITRMARRINPEVQVLARSHYLEETIGMRQAGANEVFSGEGEVALAMTEYILRFLGSPPDQIDRERERVRAEVFR